MCEAGSSLVLFCVLLYVLDEQPLDLFARRVRARQAAGHELEEGALESPQHLKTQGSPTSERWKALPEGHRPAVSRRPQHRIDHVLRPRVHLLAVATLSRDRNRRSQIDNQITTSSSLAWHKQGRRLRGFTL